MFAMGPMRRPGRDRTRSAEREVASEGIEDEAQLQRLQAERCDIGQGFLFARPMEAASAASSWSVGRYAAGNEPSVRSTLTRPRNPSSPSST